MGRSSQVADKGHGVDTASFIDVMAQVTSGYMMGHYGGIPAGNVKRLDAIVACCTLLERIHSQTPELMAKKAAPNQLWTVTSGAAGSANRTRQRPPAGRFLLPTTTTTPSAKPTYGGFYTSPRLPEEGTSMSLGYLRRWGGTLFERPWMTYALTPVQDAIIFQICTGSDWQAHVERFPLKHGNFVYPDWRKIASAYDAVRIGLSSVVATQGVPLNSSLGLIAAAYWDVETTIWLRWRFAATPQLVDFEE
jgi:hypothetical protein